MAQYELKLPKMGESVAEATITAWLKEVGDTIELDEPVVEIATDKVDSEVPSEVEGVLVEKRFAVDDVVQVGETLAVIEVSGSGAEETAAIFAVDKEKPQKEQPLQELEEKEPEEAQALETAMQAAKNISWPEASLDVSTAERFYSPLVKNIAKKENISLQELEKIPGSGKDNRVTKDDILNYVKEKKSSKIIKEETTVKSQNTISVHSPVASSVTVSGEDEVIELSRMGKLIAKHMVHSVHTAAHVQSFIEVDVTEIVQWREKVKDEFLKKEGEKITYTPIFMEAVAKAIKDYPLINISLDGEKVIKKKSINLGMATALADGNLIVPVIKNADRLNLVGMTKAVNDLAIRARNGKLKPDDTQGGTYTVTNVGSFDSVMGTPIINQPQVGILALGAIRKVPAVIETKKGDFIGIRHKMFLSHSYDHRVVNGALGGMFIKRVKEYLENFDTDRTF
ncbi:MAG: diapophytoene dehydrogenase [Flavobacteriales bacterium]|nr:MAG: diapophytoene dehydrogenase [Flavobacteriales bacterium]